MKKGIVVADSGTIFSLAAIDCLFLLDLLFNEVKISKAVWVEISLDASKQFHERIWNYCKYKVHPVVFYYEDLQFEPMDLGEKESLKLYQLISADFLLIDDKKARIVAEKVGARCIGTLGILIIAKENGQIKSLRDFLWFLF